jgi:hypothetical protein
VTATSLALYVGLILLAWPDGFGFYLTRAVYLAITGYSVGFLGRQRRVLESNLNELTRSLHDGYAQTLAAVNLRVENCRELIRDGQTLEACAELADLQTGITREYDELRSYVRSLQGLANTPSGALASHETRFLVRAQFEAELPLLEHALNIMLEGARNASRHAPPAVGDQREHERRQARPQNRRRRWRLRGRRRGTVVDHLTGE